MGNFALTLFSMSATGSILAILAMAAKRLFADRLPSSLLYYIWIIVLLRMVVPISSDYSLLNVIYTILDKAARSSVSLDAVFATVSAENGAMPLQVGFMERNSGGFVGFIMDNLLWIWLTGAVIYLIHTFGSYIAYCRRILSSSKAATEGDTALLRQMTDSRRIRLLSCRRVETPMLIGLLHPCIILPDSGYVESGHEQALRNILLHELTHYRRGDLLLKQAVNVIAAVHWFNPLVYLMSREISLCGELACDEGAVKGLDENERMSYGHTLIMTAAGIKYGAAYVAFASRKETLRERVLSVRTPKRSTGATVSLGISIVSLLTAAALIIGVITPAPRPEKSPIEGISYNAYEQYIAIVDSLHYSDYDSMYECFGTYNELESYFYQFLCYEDFVCGDVDSVGENCYNEALFAACCYRAIMSDYRAKQSESRMGSFYAASARQLSDTIWSDLSLATSREELEDICITADAVGRDLLRYMQ